MFVSILADFFTPPSQFQGLGVFALNAEKCYDERMPSKLAKNAEMIGLYSVIGGHEGADGCLYARDHRSGRQSDTQLRGEADSG